MARQLSVTVEECVTERDANGGSLKFRIEHAKRLSYFADEILKRLGQRQFSTVISDSYNAGNADVHMHILSAGAFRAKYSARHPIEDPWWTKFVGRFYRGPT